jgi:hypothetical protein
MLIDQGLALGDEHCVMGLPDGHLLQVEVSNFDTNPIWRHAGGAEDWVVSAPGKTVSIQKSKAFTL